MRKRVELLSYDIPGVRFKFMLVQISNNERWLMHLMIICCECILVFTLLNQTSLSLRAVHLIYCCSLLQPVLVKEEEREGRQESRGRSCGELGGKAQRQGRDAGLVSRTEDQRHEAEGQEGNTHNDVNGVCCHVKRQTMIAFLKYPSIPFYHIATQPYRPVLCTRL